MYTLTPIEPPGKTGRDNRNWSPWRVSQVTNDLSELLVPDGEGKGFETLEQVDTRRELWVSQLRAAKTPEANALANKLESCWRGCRCNSPACPACQRRHRQVIFDWKTSKFFPNLDIKTFLETDVGKLPPYAKLPYFQKATKTANTLTGMRSITLLNRNWSVPISRLNTIRPDLIVGQVKAQLSRSAMAKAMIVGGIHGQYFQPRQEWDLHLHLTVSGVTGPDIEGLRKRYYGNYWREVCGKKVTPLLSNPIPTIQDYVETASYSHQMLWPFRPNKRDPTSGPRQLICWGRKRLVCQGPAGRQRSQNHSIFVTRSTSKAPYMKIPVLPEQQNVEWLLWMDTLSLTELLFTINVGYLKDGVRTY